MVYWNNGILKVILFREQCQWYVIDKYISIIKEKVVINVRVEVQEKFNGE